ncbi:uncharacterized protein BCR38DRAFT_337433 [Pseudomassariella vexata]|uniref:Uncharacterized protein n=1 Tax=Pseudomassariella vexata TaxID=1141098 RepID=A0A1Y2E654_9PEZI|nr:uncharacterized protein BCR38DRAFT_337433 [Pseudomassariella vexata]ORY67038.1 hypothetical protein BCR38DRAFT_337433 [Pseudomassariella vexata]
MARQRNAAKASKPASLKRKKDGGSPAPFKTPPEILLPLIETLEEKHIYIMHIDNKPVEFKRKIFAVPVLMNIAIAALFVWRMYYIVPWYMALLASTLGYANETTFVATEMEWEELLPEIIKRTGNFMADLMLFVFLWPWPYEFCFGQEHSNPVTWRWIVGFRDREVIVRRSRSWDNIIGDVINDESSKSLFMAQIGLATAPMFLQEKTGYLTMNKEWDLDWGVMMDATIMVDKKMIAIEAFKMVVLVHQEEFGWLAVDMRIGDNAHDDERRTQVFAFRDALAALGKEDLFFRWIEIVQFESTQPSGFGPEKQIETARQIRELFQKNGVDFDEVWKSSTGKDALEGL